MSVRRFLSLGWVAASAWLWLSPHAYAQVNDRATIEAARGALERGDADGAERLLTGIAATDETANDLDFLRGTAAFAKGNYDLAIAHYKALLTRDGTLNRVRLDLARSYFSIGDDAAAEYHFRAA